MSASQDDLRAMFYEAENRGDKDTASMIMSRLELPESQEFETLGDPKEPEVAPEISPDPETKEAPFLAQVGRGMMDVYEGSAQVVSSVADKAVKYEQALDVLRTPGSQGNLFSKSIVSAIVALNQDTEATEYNKAVAADSKLYNKNNPDFQAGRMFGSIATPLTLIPGGAAKSLGGKVLSGTASGSLFSMAQVVENVDEFWAEKGEQALWGGGFGVGIPAAGKVFKSLIGWVDEITKPLYESGIVRDVGKFLKEHITENKDKIIRSIEKAMKDGDTRTVGQIIADSTSGTSDDFGGMLVRLEKDLSRESDSLKSLYARQSSTRKQSIDLLAGTESDFIAATSKRSADGLKSYTAAFSENVVPDAQLKEILNNRFAKTALKEATDIAQANGSTSSTEVLHFVKLGLDKQLAKSGDLALSKAEKKVVGKVKDSTVKWLENKNPAYEAARKEYQINSIPINRMQVGKEIKNKLINSLETESPSTFATAIRDSHKLIKKATGSTRYSGLDDIFSPSEVKNLKVIASELGIEKKAAKMASESKSVLGSLSSEVELSLPHILSRPIVITNHILKKLGQDKSVEYKQILSSLMKNPDDFLRVYGGSSDNIKTKMAIDITRRLTTMITSQEAAKESGSN